MEVLVAGAVVVGGQRGLLVVGQRCAQLLQVLVKVEALHLVLDGVRQDELAVHVIGRAVGLRGPLRARTALLRAGSDLLQRSTSRTTSAMRIGTAHEFNFTGCPVHTRVLPDTEPCAALPNTRLSGKKWARRAHCARR